MNILCNKLLKFQFLIDLYEKNPKNCNICYIEESNYM